MIETTTFSHKELKDFVLKNYNIVVNNVKKINEGSANLFSLNDDTYVLKEFQSKYSEDDITKETLIAKHLEQSGIKVPSYIKTINGTFHSTHCGKIVILQKFIEGHTLQPNSATHEQMIESANLLGQICKSMESLNFKLNCINVESWFSRDNIVKAIENTKKLKNLITNEKHKDEIIKDLNDKIEMLNYFLDCPPFQGLSNLTCLNTHGDFSLQQFIYKDNKINAVIDFVSACKMPIVWEIIRSYSYIDSKAKDGTIDINNLIDYVKEFCKFEKLNEYDLKMMPYIYLVQMLNSLFGYKQFIENNSQTSLLNFAFFRTNLCRFLFSHAEEIGNKLIENINKN